MAFSFVELTHCLLFGLIHLSIGQTVGQETGSDVSIAIDFRQYPKSCKEFQIYFLRLAGEVRLLQKIMSFSDNGDKCLSVVANEYVQRICNADIKFPISVTFILRNVSFLDTGKYSARSEGKILGERIMFVTDRALRECTGNAAEINFVLPLFPFKEVLVVMFYPTIPISQPHAVIQVADTVSGVCATIVNYLQCKINRYSLGMTIKSVGFLNQGTYALIGNSTGVVHESAILLVIGNGGEGCSTLGFTTKWMVDSSVVNGEPDYSKMATHQVVTVTGVEEDTIGQTIAQDTGSNVSFVIDFNRYQLTCMDIEIYISGLATEPIWSRKIMSFSDDGDKCLSVVSKEYEKRIFNAEINFPISLSFILQNVSFHDTGKYYATSKRNLLGERILFVTDNVLRTCIGKQEEFDFVLPLYPSKEALDVMFYSRMMQPLAVIQVADPVSDTCTAYVKYLQCEIKRYNLHITIKTVRFFDHGIYAVIGHLSGVVHESAILHVIENGEPGCPLGVFTTDQTVIVNTVQETTTDQSLMIKKEYFLGGGAVAGIVLLGLTFLFICKRCRRRSGNVASDGSYENTDVHYYSTLSIQRVSSRVDAMRSFTESQRQKAINMETNVYDQAGSDMATDTTSEVTNPSETYYITPF